MTRLMCFLLIMSFGKLSGQDCEEASIAKSEKLKWEGDYTYVTNPYDTSFGFYNYHLRSLAYSEKNNVLWKIDLPERMQRHVATQIYDKVNSGNDQSVGVKKLTSREVDINNQKEFLRYPELISKDIIAISDQTGFLLLDKSTGTILHDIPDKDSNENFSIDQGRYAVKVKNSICSGCLAHGAEFISHCSGYLFYFSGSELFIFDKRNGLQEKIEYQETSHLINSGINNLKASFKQKKYSVEITGRIFVK